EVESDNALLVELLLSGGGASSSLVKLQLLLNGVDDHMTKCADTSSSLIRLFRSPPASIMNLLGRDRNIFIYS
ncbi:hypothetical protein Gogos_017271, partial [Gossypium gossypioides]|nr:hypothetical protein [Gossypium gossypioides]